VTKYPPSLSFITLTLGIDLLLLSAFAGLSQQLMHWGRPLLVFGRTALFFYLLHLYVYLVWGLAFPNGSSTTLMYAMWLVGLLILYPLCLWYAAFRQKKPLESVWRFF
jgi:hypothetical protein